MNKTRVTVFVLLICFSVLPLFAGGQQEAEDGKPYSGVKIRVLADQRSEVVKLREKRE